MATEYDYSNPIKLAFQDGQLYYDGFVVPVLNLLTTILPESNPGDYSADWLLKSSLILLSLRMKK